MTAPIVEKKWYTIPEVAEMLGFGVTKTKFLVLEGRIRSVKEGTTSPDLAPLGRRVRPARR